MLRKDTHFIEISKSQKLPKSQPATKQETQQKNVEQSALLSCIRELLNVLSLSFQLQRVMAF
jgi:hypothetical protein